MITLEQIRTLDSKVQQAVEVIETLRSENSRLKGTLSSYEAKISELEVLIDSFKSDQGEIEEGIQKALERLNHISKNEQVVRKKPDTNSQQDQDIEEIESLDDGDLLEQEEPVKSAELDIF